jgi:type I restriction enzyme, S subunit
MAECLNSVPEGWKSKTLGEVCQKIQTTDPRKTPDIEFRYIDVSSVCNQRFEIVETQLLKGEKAPSRARRLVQTSDVLFATVRPTLKRIAIVPESLNGQVCSTGYFVLRPQPELMTRLIYYFLQTNDFMYEMEAIQKGASYPAVNDSEVRSQKISFPALPEQERIVGVLDGAFEGIATATAQAEKNLQNGQELFQSVLQSTFSQKGDDWEETTLGEVIVEIRNGVNCKQNKDKIGSPISRIETISYATVNYEKVGYSVISEEQRRKFLLRTGDVLFSHINSPIHVGKTALVKSDKELVHGVNLLLMRVGNDILPTFFNYYLVKLFKTGFWLGVCKQSVNQASVNQTDIKRVQFFYPPQSCQQAVVEKLDALSEETKRLEAIYQRKLDALAELKQSLLQRAFTGQL